MYGYRGRGRGRGGYGGYNNGGYDDGVCRLWKQGKCGYGDNCRFRHEEKSIGDLEQEMARIQGALETLKHTRAAETGSGQVRHCELLMVSDKAESKAAATVTHDAASQPRVRAQWGSPQRGQTTTVGLGFDNQLPTKEQTVTLAKSDERWFREWQHEQQEEMEQDIRDNMDKQDAKNDKKELRSDLGIKSLKRVSAGGAEPPAKRFSTGDKVDYEGRTEVKKALKRKLELEGEMEDLVAKWADHESHLHALDAQRKQIVKKAEEIRSKAVTIADKTRAAELEMESYQMESFVEQMQQESVVLGTQFDEMVRAYKKECGDVMKQAPTKLRTVIRDAIMQLAVQMAVSSSVLVDSGAPVSPKFSLDDVEVNTTTDEGWAAVVTPAKVSSSSSSSSSGGDGMRTTPE